MYLFDLFASPFRNLGFVFLNTEAVPPTSSLYEQPVSDGRSTVVSFRERCATPFSERYNRYNLPSHEQRRRNRKELFVNGPDDTSIAHAGPNTVHPTADITLSSAHVDMAAPHGEEHDLHTHIPNDAQSRRPKRKEFWVDTTIMAGSEVPSC